MNSQLLTSLLRGLLREVRESSHGNRWPFDVDRHCTFILACMLGDLMAAHRACAASVSRHSRVAISNEL